MSIITEFGTYTLVSRPDPGRDPDGSSNPWSAISGDGRWVAFSTSAALVAADTNGWTDAYLFDRATGTLDLISRPVGTAADTPADPVILSKVPAISDDGRFVAFDVLHADRLVPGNPGNTVLYDRAADTLLPGFSGLSEGARFAGSGSIIHDATERLDCADSTVEAGSARLFDPAIGTPVTILPHCGVPGSVRQPDISADGRFIAYRGITTGPDHTQYTNLEYDVFLHDTATGTTRKLTGTDSNGMSFAPVISDDGRWTAFVSRASNLVADDTNGSADVFVFDRIEDRLTRVTAPGDQEPNGAALENPISISADGRTVWFGSTATNLVEGVNGNGTIYAYDTATGAVTQVSPRFYLAATSDAFSTGRNNAFAAAGDDSGNFAVFATHDRLDAADTRTNDVDIYLVDRRMTTGDDRVFMGPNEIFANAGPGNDDVVGRDNPERVLGGAGNDRVVGAGGADTLEGGDGADTLNGGDGDDIIAGGDTDTDLRDVIYGGAGNDRIDAGHGNDQVYGGEGDDTVEGGFGVDEIIGQGGDDVLTGSAFSDLIFGGDGNDFINGGFGSDRVNGGAGRTGSITSVSPITGPTGSRTTARPMATCCCSAAPRHATGSR